MSSIIPIEFDSYLGKSAMPGIESQYGSVNPDPKVQAYVNSVGKRIVPHTQDPKLPYTFKPLSSNQINAFALPGGPVYVLNGLLNMFSNEDELACVIGHECGHINKRHSVKQLENTLGATGLLMGIDAFTRKDKSSKDLLAVSAGLLELAKLGFSREDEYQADTEGIRYAVRAGYNPNAMVSFFTKLQSLSPGLNKFEEWTSSHPDTQKRIDNVNAVIAKEFPDAGKIPTTSLTPASGTSSKPIITPWTNYIPYGIGILGFGTLASVLLMRKMRK